MTNVKCILQLAKFFLKKKLNWLFNVDSVIVILKGIEEWGFIQLVI